MAETPTDFLNETARAVIDNEVEAAFSIVWPVPGTGLPVAAWCGDPSFIIDMLDVFMAEIHGLQSRNEKGAGTMPLRIIDPGQPAPAPTNEDAGLV